MAEPIQQAKSKYIKPAREVKIFSWVAVIFMFSMFVLPQYFGVPFPLFDLTALRIMIVAVVFMMIADKERLADFMNVVAEASCSKIIIPYLLVITYTMGLRADINAFLNPFIEIITFYLVIYLIKDCLGVEKTIKLIIAFSYLIAFLGVIEYVMGRSPFSYLETIKGIYTGQFVRSGSYRIMSSCNHSLGYGLMLTIMVPFACLDMKKNEINLLQRPMLLLLLALNVFFCGSRSTLSVFLLEVFILVLLSPQIRKKKLIIIGSVIMVAFLAFLLAAKNTPIGKYFLLQITSIIDELLGTELAVQFGANTAALSSSSNYRDQLKYIFFVDWLNPFLGLGRKRSFASEINGSFIRSVDNFYIAEFVRYAYPGLVSYVLFLLSFVKRMAQKVLHSTSGTIRILFTSSCCYLINLFWVDSLQTLKYLYLVFALYICIEFQEKEKTKEMPFRSKYLKKPGGAIMKNR